MSDESSSIPKSPKGAELKRYRAIAHKLHPIVTIAGNGLSPGVLGELERALDDHELVKIKVSVGDRDLRDELINTLCAGARAALVQRIGNTATVMRRNPNADPRKSNLKRVL